MDRDLHNKIEEALQSLDGITKATPRPYFITRLEARMQREKSKWDIISSFVSRPAIVFAGICFILVINVAVILTSSSLNNPALQQNNEISAADEYNSVSAPLYEYVNATP